MADELAAPDGLTARASTFTRRDVVRAWCDRLPAGGDVAQVIRRVDGRVVSADTDEPRYSTPELLALEQGVVAGATGRQDAGVAVAVEQAVEDALARRPSMAGEQAAMVRRLATSVRAWRSWSARLARARPSRSTPPATPGRPAASA